MILESFEIDDKVEDEWKWLIASNKYIDVEFDAP